MRSLILLIMLGYSVQAFSQKADISGQLADSTSGDMLSFATISLVNAKDSSLVTFTMADDQGRFIIKNIPPGNYLLSSSYVGYITMWKGFKLEGRSIQLGRVFLARADSVAGLTVVAKRAPVVMNNDTLEFNAEHFRTQPNAVVEELLKKLPGVTIDPDGSVRVNGRLINRVLVNGKDFFGTDPKMATRNLPADAIDKVQVFEKMSDLAAFTGVDDGNGEQAINLKLKKDRNNAVFGRASAAAGDKRYDTQTNLNRFNNREQLSLLAMLSNTNRQGFTMADIMNFTGEGARQMKGGGGISITQGVAADFGLPVLGQGSSEGIGKTFAGGINYNNNWRQDRTRLSANLLTSSIKTELDKTSFRRYLYPGNEYSYRKFLSSDKQAGQLRASAVLDHQLNVKSSFRIQNRITTQRMATTSVNNYSTLSVSGQTMSEGDIRNLGKANALDVSNELLFRHRFEKKGRTFSLLLEQFSNSGELEGWQRGNYQVYSPGLIDSMLQRLQLNNGKHLSLGATATYTEPMRSNGLVELAAALTRNTWRSDRANLDFDSATLKFDTLQGGMSSDFTSMYTVAGLSARYRVNTSKWNLSAGVKWQLASLEGSNHKTTYNSFTGNNDLLALLNFQWKFNKASNLTVNYSPYTEAPAIQHMQPAPDLSDPMNIIYGNPDLRRAYIHQLNINYLSVKNLSGKNLFVFATLKVTDNATVYMDKLQPGGVRNLYPVNVNGILSAFASVSTGFPVRTIYSRFEYGIGLNYNRTISFLNQQKNFARMMGASPFIKWRYNLPDKLELTFTSRVYFRKAVYSLQPGSSKDYVQQSYTVDLVQYIRPGINSTVHFTYSSTNDLTTGFNRRVPLLNYAVAKSFLKNRSGEIKLSVNNIFNQGIGVNRNVQQYFIEDVEYNALGRFFMIGITGSILKTVKRT